jgi:hypothetical protein
MIACKDNTRKPRETRQRLAREREIETETERRRRREREREERKRERNATTHKWSESLAKLAWQDRTDHICPSPSLNAPDLPRTLSKLTQTYFFTSTRFLILPGVYLLYVLTGQWESSNPPAGPTMYPLTPLFGGARGG